MRKRARVSLSIGLAAAFFAFVGVVFLAHWVVTDPGYEVSATQDKWSEVLFFSAILLLLGIAWPIFGRLVGGRSVRRLSLLAGAAATLSSLANIVEDGLHHHWAFFVYVLGTGIGIVALPALTATIAFTERGRRRLLALVPAGVMAGILLYVAAGGVIMLVAWLGAAVLTLALPAGAAARAATS